MTDKQWPQIRSSRLGKGVFIEAEILYALRVADDPAHARVTARLLELAADGLPLAISYLSLTEAALRVHRVFGTEAASELVKETREVMNVILPGDEEVKGRRADPGRGRRAFHPGTGDHRGDGQKVRVRGLWVHAGLSFTQDSGGDLR